METPGTAAGATTRSSTRSRATTSVIPKTAEVCPELKTWRCAPSWKERQPGEGVITCEVRLSPPAPGSRGQHLGRLIAPARSCCSPRAPAGSEKTPYVGRSVAYQGGGAKAGGETHVPLPRPTSAGTPRRRARSRIAFQARFEGWACEFSHRFTVDRVTATWRANSSCVMPSCCRSVRMRLSEIWGMRRRSNRRARRRVGRHLQSPRGSTAVGWRVPVERFGQRGPFFWGDASRGIRRTRDILAASSCRTPSLAARESAAQDGTLSALCATSRAGGQPSAPQAWARGDFIPTGITRP